jgi:hypothetical protein
MISALYNYFAVAIISIGVISCDTKEKGSLVNTNYAPAPQSARQISQPAQPVQQVAPVSTTAPAAVSGIQANPSGVAPKLNPKHGDPGHRCDLPVGEPLDVEMGANLKALNASQQPTAAPKLNPKHGDPGHRCDIAVGAPL